MARERESGKGGKVESVYNKAMLYSMMATVPMIAYMGVFAQPLVYVFFSRSFTSAPLYLALMALGTIIGLFGMYATALFTAVGKTSRLLYYGAIAMVVQVAALLVLTPLAGVTGNIVAVFFIGSIATDLLLVRGARTSLGVRTHYGKLARMFACNAAMAAVLALGLLANSPVLELAYGLVAIAVLYPPLLAVSGAVDKEDVKLLAMSMKELPALNSVARPAIGYLKVFVRNTE